MSEFKVRVGKSKKSAGANGGAEPPRERKVIHPGLQQVATSICCLKCGDFLEWSNFSEKMLVSACSCGLWFKNTRQLVRWIRWSSAPSMLGNELLSFER
jgi:hypothetical protein